MPAALQRTESRWRVYQLCELFLPRLLKWDDRNFMAFGVEGRYPLLDHELIELCLSFRPEALYRRGWTKWPLRIAMQGSLPTPIERRRTKVGFEVPQDRWLCGELRPLIERWLGADRPIWDLADREEVRRLACLTWRLAGRRDEPGQALLRLFLFDRWMELFAVQA